MGPPGAMKSRATAMIATETEASFVRPDAADKLGLQRRAGVKWPIRGDGGGAKRIDVAEGALGLNDGTANAERMELGCVNELPAGYDLVIGRDVLANVTFRYDGASGKGDGGSELTRRRRDAGRRNTTGQQPEAAGRTAARVHRGAGGKQREQAMKRTEIEEQHLRRLGRLLDGRTTFTLVFLVADDDAERERIAARIAGHLGGENRAHRGRGRSVDTGAAPPARRGGRRRPGTGGRAGRLARRVPDVLPPPELRAADFRRTGPPRASHVDVDRRAQGTGLAGRRLLVLAIGHPRLHRERAGGGTAALMTE